MSIYFYRGFNSKVSVLVKLVYFLITFIFEVFKICQAAPNVEEFIYSDIDMIITYQERADWLSDDEMILNLAPRILEVTCQAPLKSLQNLKRRLSEEVEEAGRVEVKWRAQLKAGLHPTLKTFKEDLHRERELLSVQFGIDQRSRCPFWLTPKAHFMGVHRDAGRLQLMLETMGSAQVIIKEGESMIGGSGQGRILGVWGLSLNAGLGVGLELGGSSTFPKDEKGQRSVQAMWTTGVPILFRGWWNRLRLDTEVALLARIPDGQWSSPLWGVRVSQGVGVSTLRVVNLLPHFMVWVGYESYHGREIIQVVRLGTRVGVSWGGD